MIHPPLVVPGVQGLLFLIVVPAAVFDLKQRRVPNWLTLVGIIAGFALNGFVAGTAGLLVSLVGFGLAMLIYFPLYLLRGMGAGDVKLMAAVGAIAGTAIWLWILLFTAIFGGISAIVVVALRGRVRKTLSNIWFIILSLAHRQAPHEGNPELDVKSEQAVRLPHAVVIAFGTISFLIAAAIWAPR